MDKLADFDAIVALDEDIDHEGFDEFVKWAKTRLNDSSSPEKANIPEVRFASSPADDDRESVAEQLENASHILVMAVGTVTGGTVQEILIRIHRALTDRPLREATRYPALYCTLVHRHMKSGSLFVAPSVTS